MGHYCGDGVERDVAHSSVAGSALMHMGTDNPTIMKQKIWAAHLPICT